MTEEKQRFLDETNALLKSVGSKEHMQSEAETKNSITYKINNLFASKTTEKPSPEKEKKDINSYIYFKNKREFDTYQKKLSSTDVEIVKIIATLQFFKLKKIFLKRKLISQNLEIISNRLNNKTISYTKLVHGIDFYIDNFIKFIELLANICTYALFFYTIAYITLHTLHNFSILLIHINSKTILYVTLLSIIAFLLSYIRTLLSAFIILPIVIIVTFIISINF